MIIEHRELQFEGVISASYKPCPRVLLQMQFELHDNNEMMKAARMLLNLACCL